MARLYRPHIPLAVRCEVATRQLSDILELVDLDVPEKPMQARLDALLGMLAKCMGCEVKDLRLDHEPALALRSTGIRNGKSYYIPDANDPEHLFYRPHGAEFDGSHDIKTRVRGDNGQFSDLALIRREKRRQKKAAGRPKKRWASRGKLSTKRFPAGKKKSWPKKSFPKRRKIK